MTDGLDPEITIVDNQNKRLGASKLRLVCSLSIHVYLKAEIGGADAEREAQLRGMSHPTGENEA